MKPTPIKRHGESKTLIFKDLATSQYAFVLHDTVRTSLQMMYDGHGPHKVISREDKTFVIGGHCKHVIVSIVWLKPAYILAEDAPGQDLQSIPELIMLPAVLEQFTFTTTNTTGPITTPKPGNQTRAAMIKPLGTIYGMLPSGFQLEHSFYHDFITGKRILVVTMSLGVKE